MDTLYEMPEVLTAGDTVEYLRSYADFPVTDGWTLTLYINGVKVLSKVATVAGTFFKFTLATGDTDDLDPGTYTWVEVATKSGNRYSADSGKLQVLLNPVSAAAGAFQSHAERALAIVVAAIEGRLTKDQESFQIDGIAVQKIPIERLIELRRIYSQEVRALQNPGQFDIPIKVKFVTP